MKIIKYLKNLNLLMNFIQKYLKILKKKKYCNLIGGRCGIKIMNGKNSLIDSNYVIK